MHSDVVVIGAGLSGLSCARTLVAEGVRTTVLESSPGLGGRCATRRVGGQPVDHGVSFLHGDDPSFLEALERAGADGLLEGWPERVEGQGQPCQPQALRPDQRRVAFRDGLAAFPKSLGSGLDVHRQTRVEALGHDGSDVALSTSDGGVRAPVVVLALPVPQARELLQPIADASEELRAVFELLSMVGTSSSLTLLAGYPRELRAPEWELCLPEESRILQLISHDSTKRRDPQWTVLVLQALPHWSRRSWDDATERWRDAMLEAAGGLIGEWATRPVWVQEHRWRWARADTGSEFSRPLLVTLPGGARIGVTGEVFARGGGAQAAWQSGRELARRLLQETGA